MQLLEREKVDLLTVSELPYKGCKQLEDRLSEAHMMAIFQRLSYRTDYLLVAWEPRRFDCKTSYFSKIGKYLALVLHDRSENRMVFWAGVHFKRSKSKALIRKCRLKIKWIALVSAEI